MLLLLLVSEQVVPPAGHHDRQPAAVLEVADSVHRVEEGLVVPGQERGGGGWLPVACQEGVPGVGPGAPGEVRRPGLHPVELGRPAAGVGQRGAGEHRLVQVRAEVGTGEQMVMQMVEKV